MLKKKEVIIFVLVIIFALLMIVLFNSINTGGNTVVITENGQILYSLPLYKNAEIKLTHNTVLIKNGEVRVTWADCKNQICVNTPSVHSGGGQIICLPNKVTVEVVKK